jgi:hypothetical protein
MHRAAFAVASVAAFVLAACKSSSGGTAPTVTTVEQKTTMEVPGNHIDIKTEENRDVIQSVIVAPMDSVWRAVPSVFAELGIEPAQVNQEEHFFANTQFRERHSMGGVRLSRYLDCGSTMGGPTADQAAITMSLTVQVAGDSSHFTHLRIEMHAYAVTEGAVVGRINCASTGQLESRIDRMLKDDVAHRTTK